MLTTKSLQLATVTKLGKCLDFMDKLNDRLTKLEKKG
jgi:hypothetical protein